MGTVTRKISLPNCKTAHNHIVEAKYSVIEEFILLTTNHFVEPLEEIIVWIATHIRRCY